MYVLAVFHSPRVDFAFRSPSGGDSAGPFQNFTKFSTGLRKLKSQIFFKKSMFGFIFWLRFSTSSKMNSVFSNRPQKTEILNLL